VTKRPLISDLQPGQFVEGVFAIHNCQLGQTKAGKPFIKCLLADRSGKLPARLWNASEQLAGELSTDGFVRIQGHTQAYQGQVQIILQNIHPVPISEVDLKQMLPSTQHDIDEMFTQLQTILETVSNPPLKAIIRSYLDDEQLMADFKQAPAAMSLHHAYLGGLLEHTLNLLRLADAICPLYPQLNRQIVIVGLFIHDMGKCAELTWQQGFGYTDEGQLVGHIARGAMWLERKAQDCSAMGHTIPQSLLMVLQHIILSHHGKAEYGALKLPATPEAIAVALLDNLDAKLNLSLAAAREGTGQQPPADLGGNFTEKIWALETRLYRPDPTASKPA